MLSPVPSCTFASGPGGSQVAPPLTHGVWCVP
jgi:hypothetical protein